MTIDEAIAAIDKKRRNVVSRDEKIKWLNNLDRAVKIEHIDTHEGFQEYSSFVGYQPDTPGTTELLVPSPYDEMYVAWLEAQIDYYNSELDRYDNSMATFQSIYRDFGAYYNRTHTPLRSTPIFS